MKLIPKLTGTSKNLWFFEETIGTWMCQPKSKPQDFDFEEKRKRRFSFFVRSKNPGRVFRGSLTMTAALIIGMSPIGPSFALSLPSDGWARMQIQAVQPTPQWCCFDHNGAANVCDLQSKNFGFASVAGTQQTADRYVWLYLKTKGSKVVDLRTLGAQCKVKNDIDPINLGAPSSAESLTLLQSLLTKDDQQLQEHTLAAIAVHADQQVDQLLRDYSADQQPIPRQKTALFWAGQLRGKVGFNLAASKLANSVHSELREHALFVISQTASTQRLTLLRQSGFHDRDPQVRAQAWFWLAQTALPNVEQDIRRGAYQDRSEQVRDQAVFALSQLPEPRGADALIALVNDKSATRALRKRALFWLSQSKQARAQAYLEKVLE
jgi:hypothetical protein